MALIESKRALFFDEKGEYHGSTSFSKYNSTFTYSNGSYNVDFKNSSYKEESVIPVLWKRRTYFYNLSNSNPIKLDKKAEPPISPRLYDIFLKTKVAQDLNDLSKGGLSQYFTPRNVLIGLGVIAVIYYLSSGGKLA